MGGIKTGTERCSVPNERTIKGENIHDQPSVSASSDDGEEEPLETWILATV